MRSVSTGTYLDGRQWQRQGNCSACHCEYPMPLRGMGKHRNCDCHCEEAAASSQ